MRPVDHPAVRAFARIPPDRAAIFTDFDGTLAPIVDMPGKAKAIRGAGPALARLAMRYALVAVVTGRPVHDVTSRLRAPGVHFAGIHGLEEKRGRKIVAVPEAEAARERIQVAVQTLRESIGHLDGVDVENKGPALAVHFRRAPDPAATHDTLRPLVERVAAASGLVVHGGRRVIEVRPRAATDKGTTVARLAAAAGVEAALFAGDDEGDLAAMNAVRALPASCVVAVLTSESPPGLRVAADVVVDGPRDVLAILRSLALPPV